MRQAVSLLLSSALLIGGLWLLGMQVFVSPVIKSRGLMAAGFLIVVGGSWLIGDFIAPLFRKK